jgi:hypothetical protein
VTSTAEVQRPPAPPSSIAIDDGVIEEARRRQRRRRRLGISAAAVVSLLAALLAPLFYGGGNALRPPSPLRPASSLTRLAGPPLSGATHLTLIVSENGGRVFLVDLDRGTARAVHGLGLQAPQLPQVTLIQHGSGVLANVIHWSCQMGTTCAKGKWPSPDGESQFLISPTGSARRIDTFGLAPHQETAQAFDATAMWVLTWPHRGPCTLALQPGSHPAVGVPCGNPEPATAGGLWIVNGNVRRLVDPRTGRTLERQPTNPTVDVTPLPGGLALESATATFPTGLTLVNLASGGRRALGWPSTLRFGYQAVPAPHGPLVAVDFGDSAYPPPPQETVNQAGDVWILNTSTGAFTHVPGFPAVEYLKVSSIAWSSDNRLVVAASGGGRTVVGVWKPGQSTLPIRTVPQLDGYSQFVALSR